MLWRILFVQESVRERFPEFPLLRKILQQLSCNFATPRFVTLQKRLSYSKSKRHQSAIMRPYGAFNARLCKHEHKIKSCDFQFSIIYWSFISYGFRSATATKHCIGIKRENSKQERGKQEYIATCKQHVWIANGAAWWISRNRIAKSGFRRQKLHLKREVLPINVRP